jgi:hypothetical protein
VWAVVVPPDYDPVGKTSAEADFPTVTLKKQANGKYQAVYRKFTQPGNYLVTVFASDKEGNVSLPTVIRVSR